MVSTRELMAYVHPLLQADRFDDYCPNGLQVEGKPYIKKIISGVTANLALINAAIEREADAILVHHGYFWKGEAPVLRGNKRQRLALLLQHNLNLIAYHLPLDVHPQLGNNAQLAKVLGFEIVKRVDVDRVSDLLTIGRVSREDMTGEQLAQHIAVSLQRAPFYISGTHAPVQQIAWCTGAAQRYIEHAYLNGANAFITGEVSESTVDFARENGLHFYAAGHYATERYGVQALGEHLSQKFQITHEFVEIDNPV